VPSRRSGKGRDRMTLGLPDHEPEKDSLGAVTTASPGAGRVVRSRAADHRNRPGSMIRENSQA
ncbi:MAG: hypothetical protein ACKVHE_20590, partial [Planctomycetales bacterium]